MVSSPPEYCELKTDMAWHHVGRFVVPKFLPAESVARDALAEPLGGRAVSWEVLDEEPQPLSQRLSASRRNSSLWVVLADSLQFPVPDGAVQR